MVELLWRMLAWVLSRRPIGERIVLHAMRKEAQYIPGHQRWWWLFNAPVSVGSPERKYPSIPFAIRLMHTMREDRSEHMHDHAWEYRDIVLMGHYIEVLKDGVLQRIRDRGCTAKMDFLQYHKIIEVDPRIGALRLQFVGPKLSTWGYRVDGKFVPWRSYDRDGLNNGEVTL